MNGINLRNMNNFKISNLLACEILIVNLNAFLVTMARNTETHTHQPPDGT